MHYADLAFDIKRNKLPIKFNEQILTTTISGI